MIQTTLPTNENIIVFWAENSSEDALIVDVGENEVDVMQIDHWVTIPNKVILELAKIIKKNGTKG